MYGCAEGNIFKYALFVSFFPHLIAEPMERTYNLLKQIDEIPPIKIFDYERMTEGLIMMLCGFF